MQLDVGSAVDRYVVEGLIGRGGVASVYRVRHSGLGTVHALKVVHVPSPAVTERLLREGRVQGKLRHPNVVSVTDLITVRGAPGLVMELVPGPALDSFLKKVRPSLEEADALARGILAGVAAAHRIGLVHRDLKPGNILLDVSDGAVVPKIVDFGLAKVLEAPSDSPIETRAGASLGTPAYMAPEQIDDASTVDERADIFALGAILYELATGERAFRGASVTDVYTAIRAGARPDIPDALPDRMNRAITEALERDLELRTPTVDALASRWIANTPAPVASWSTRALEVASRPVQPVSLPQASPSTSTFAGENSLTGPTHETWTDDGVALAATVPDLLSQPPKQAERRAGWWLAGVVSALALGGAAVWWSQPAPTPQLAPGVVPQVSSDAAVQRQMEASWDAFLGADFAEAERRLRTVREAEPEVPLPHVLASSASFFMGDVTAGLEAMGQARGVVATGSDGPGAGLVRVFESMQLRGAATGPELDTWIADHPDDYLARILAALYCSSSSDAAVCERAHAVLLEADDSHPVAWVAIARSWMDLGDLDRVRMATGRGLQIDPLEPELLGFEGTAWMATGDVDQARRAFAAALEADPRRRGPKVGLAQAALIADDGTWERVTAELLAPTVPAAERVGVHTEAAETLIGLGRMNEAEEHLFAARDIEATEGTPLGVLSTMSKRSAIHQWRGEREALVQLVIDQATLIARSPSIPNPVRNRYAAYPAWAEGMLAAQRGDRAGVLEGLEGVQAAEVQQSHVVDQMKRELAVLDRDAEAIRANARGYWTDCDRHGGVGNAMQRAGLMDEAEEEWLGVLESACRLHRPERAQRVRALVGLAEVAHERGDSESAAKWTAQASALWPGPDADLPLTSRLNALREHR